MGSSWDGFVLLAACVRRRRVLDAVCRQPIAPAYDRYRPRRAATELTVMATITVPKTYESSAWVLACVGREQALDDAGPTQAGIRLSPHALVARTRALAAHNGCVSRVRRAGCCPGRATSLIRTPRAFLYRRGPCGVLDVAPSRSLTRPANQRRGDEMKRARVAHAGVGISLPRASGTQEEVLWPTHMYVHDDR